MAMARLRLKATSLVVASIGAALLLLDASRGACQTSTLPFGGRSFPVSAIDFKGVVQDAAGNSISGASLSWYWTPVSTSSSAPAMTATTPADGTFDFGHLSVWPRDGAVFILARANGYAIGGTAYTPGAANPERLEITLFPACSLTTRFVRADGTPVAGARVVVSSERMLWSPNPPVSLPFAKLGPIAPSEVTGQDGSATFPDLPQGWIVSLDIDDPRYALLDFRGSVTITKSNSMIANPIPVQLGSEIDGTLTDGAGKPAEGVTVYTGTDRDSLTRPTGQSFLPVLSRTTVTGADGTFQFQKLPPGRYEVGAQVRRSDSQTMVVHPVGDVELKGGDRRSDIALRMIPGAVITGIVTDKSTGQPLAGTYVIVSKEGQVGVPVSTSRTTADGRYQFCLYGGTYVVYVMNDTADAAAPIPVQEGQTSTVDLKAVPGWHP